MQTKIKYKMYKIQLLITSEGISWKTFSEYYEISAAIKTIKQNIPSEEAQQQILIRQALDNRRLKNNPS